MASKRSPLLTLLQCTAAAAPALVLGLSAGQASAQDYAVGGGVSTLGVFIEPSYSINDQMTLRAPIYYGSFDTDLEDDGNKVDGKIESFSGVIALDYYPTSTGFFVSGGLAFGGYDFSGNTTQITAEGNTYSGAFGVKMEQKNDVAPQFSLGYRHATMTGMSVNLEAGARIATYEVSVSGTEALTPQGQQDVASEVQSINDSLSDFPVVPFLSVSLSWRF